MANPFTTPGIYITETGAFPAAVIPVPTAIPAFVGYTARANKDGTDYTNVPVKIESLQDFMSYFGKLADDGVSFAPESEQQVTVYHLTPTTELATSDISFDGRAFYIEPDPATVYYLYNSIKFFYANGGEECYIVSVGAYGPASGSRRVRTDALVNSNLSADALITGIDVLTTQPDVTLVIVPDALLVSATDYQLVAQKMLQHCGTNGSRVAIIDIPGGADPDPILWRDDIASFRAAIGEDFLGYGAAYYPFLRTTIVQDADINFNHLGGSQALTTVLPGAANEPLKSLLAAIDESPGQGSTAQIESSLLSASTVYSQIHDRVLARINTLPPGGALAGIYNVVDNSRSVWNAPANVPVNSVTETTLKITSDMQSELNVDAITGKSINAIRSFVGRGVLVWGARTLDGNSSDWRYINVRRTVIMIEQSIKLAIQACVFETNDLATWTKVRRLIENFLVELWREGAMQGSKPEEAFAVQVGLGVTMTNDDIVRGIMKISVLLALVRPAEFLMITLEQKIQTQ